VNTRVQLLQVWEKLRRLSEYTVSNHTRRYKNIKYINKLSFDNNQARLLSIINLCSIKILPYKKSIFASLKILLDTDREIILLDYKNNYMGK